MYKNFGKRILDFSISLILLLFLLPVLLVVAIMVRVKMGNPIFFKQDRPGQNEKIFTLYKFRTMINSTSKDGRTLENEERYTNFGRFLRSTSLDELPELFNILRGDMSLVGPRPLLTEYLPLYSSEQRKRHLVKPGLTGLAQINGRNELSWEDKFALDCEYVENISLKTDVKILINTTFKVLRREGIDIPKGAKFSKFKGNSKKDK